MTNINCILKKIQYIYINKFDKKFVTFNESKRKYKVLSETLK